MENEFSKNMISKSDEQLLRLVTVDREKYQTLAIEAAEFELGKRGINHSEFEDLKKQSVLGKQREREGNFVPAGSGLRFVNFLIDSVFVWILYAMMVFTLNLFLDYREPDFLIYVLMIAIYVVYYAFMETSFQKSVGKFVTRTKVVNIYGGKPTSGDIVARTLYRFIPFDRISFLFVKNGFHDYLSKTMVIKDK